MTSLRVSLMQPNSLYAQINSVAAFLSCLLASQLTKGVLSDVNFFEVSVIFVQKWVDCFSFYADQLKSLLLLYIYTSETFRQSSHRHQVVVRQSSGSHNSLRFIIYSAFNLQCTVATFSKSGFPFVLLKTEAFQNLQFFSKLQVR